MDAYIEDFVNREEALAAIWGSIEAQSAQRLWLVTGIPGIGKTYLLDECRARGRNTHMVCLRIDLHDTRMRDVPTLILHLAEQLGVKQAVNTLAAAQQAATLAQPPQPALPASTGDMIGADIGAVASGGMVAVGKGITQISGQVVTYVTQTVRYDDPWVQQQTRLRLTEALRADLAALAAPHKVLLLVDGWSAPKTDVKVWMCDHLFDWIASGAVQHMSAAIAETDNLPNFPFPNSVVRLTLSELTETAVEEYWVRKRRLPHEELAGALRYSGGVPLVLALIADQIARRTQRSAL